MAGRGAKLAPHADMDAAEAALASGKSPEDVWKTHGVELGPENHQPTKFEIDDANARVNTHDSSGAPLFKPDTPGAKELSFSGKAEDVFHHPDLYGNYPEMKDYATHLRIDPSLSSPEAAFYPGEKAIYGQGPSAESLRTALIHEADHGVSSIEGFDPGANLSQIKDAMVEQLRSSNRVIPKDIDDKAYRLYRQNMGEASAWGSEARADMPARLKAAIPPSASHRTTAGVLPHENLLPYEKLPGS
jgi:hypothetical protein